MTERLTEHVYEGRHETGIWHYWREDEQDSPAYGSSIAIIHELAQALLAERERRAKLRATLEEIAGHSMGSRTDRDFREVCVRIACRALREDGEGRDGD